MCLDISFTIELDEIREVFPDIVFDEQITINYDLADHILGPGNFSPHAIIYLSKDDQLPHMRLMNWGIVPFWTNDSDKLKKFMPLRSKWLNIQSERILDDPQSYWYKIRNRRCLIPVTGIYEHRHIKGWKNKVPYLVWLCNQRAFFLPGLYSVAEVADKETGEITRLWTFGLVTRTANEVMRRIHNGGDNKWRMPLFLRNEQAQQWLQPDLNETEYREILNFMMPAEELAYHTTFTIRGSKPRPDNKAKHELWNWEKLPALGTANPDDPDPALF